MLSHLERQPRNKERRNAWLKHIAPLLNGLGLVLLAHFRRIFPLFFQWMHADDDETVLLVIVICDFLHKNLSYTLVFPGGLFRVVSHLIHLAELSLQIET